MRYNTPELVEVGAALTTVLGEPGHPMDDNGVPPTDSTAQPTFELN